MEKILCPSMMCADISNLSREVSNLDEAGIDIYHLDVMDGNYVPNFGMGLQDVEYICKNSEKPCDVHLMIENPGRYIDLFAKLGVNIIYVHPESDIHIVKTLQEIRKSDVKAGIAVNPETSVEVIKPLLPMVDYVMVMTVNPGFAGQKFISSVDEKIRELLDLQKKYNYKLMIDGACSPEVVKNYSQLGVNGFILGTSALFGKELSYSQIIKQLREM